MTNAFHLTTAAYTNILKFVQRIITIKCKALIIPILRHMVSTAHLPKIASEGAMPGAAIGTRTCQKASLVALRGVA